MKYFTSCSQGVFGSAGDVNSSDNSSRSAETRQKIVSYAAMIAAAAVIAGPVLPSIGIALGIGAKGAVKTLLSRLF